LKKSLVTFGVILILLGSLFIGFGTSIIDNPFLPNTVFTGTYFTLNFSPVDKDILIGETVMFSSSVSMQNAPSYPSDGWFVISQIYVDGVELKDHVSTVPGISYTGGSGDFRDGTFSLKFDASGRHYVDYAFAVLFGGAMVIEQLHAQAVIDVGSIQYGAISVGSTPGGYVEVSKLYEASQFVQTGELRTFTYPEGSTLNLIAHYQNGYSFLYWLFGDGSINSNYHAQIVLAKSMSVQAVFSGYSPNPSVTPAPTIQPTPLPTPIQPTPVPTATPAPTPTVNPTISPTTNPTGSPSSTPSFPPIDPPIQLENILLIAFGVLLAVLGGLIVYLGSKQRR
jgi:hypothetical protein